MVKHTLIIILLLASSIILRGQEKEHLYFLETDSTWRKEMFLFPISFARDINYKGVEDARFPVGWEDQDSPNFWSYAFAWNIEHAETITGKDLEVDLQKYFNGLMGSDQTSVQLQKEGETANVAKFTGMVKTTDAFFTQKPMTLNVKVEKIYCEEKKKSILVFRFSPKALGTKTWEKLQEVQLPGAVYACEETQVYKIHELVNLCYEYGQFNGSVLVAKDGKVIYKHGFGEANKEWDIPNETNTKHRLASISKQFTAMLIVQLVAEDKLKLDLPITNYLPDYPKTNGDKITIHHLLTHTSGIPNYTSFPNYWEIMRSPHSPADLVKLFADLELEFVPGAEFAYSNSAYILLGILIEKITGKTYAQVLQERIFSPLKMNDSGYDTHEKVLKNRAAGYNRFANTFENASYIDMFVAYTAGGIYSTVEDLYLWDQALYGEKLLPKKYKDLMFEQHIPAWGGQHYGYGWEIGKIRVGNTREQVETIGHSGNINGFNTQITRIPSDQSLVVLLNNTGGAPLYDMTSAIIGILKDQPYILPRKSLAYSFLDSLEKEGLEAALSFYQEKKESDDYHLEEREMNESGYKLLQSGNAKDAAAIFELNTAAFPRSFNAFDSYGEALLLLGDTVQAIENYKQSVKLNPTNEKGVQVLQGFGIDLGDVIVKVPVAHLKLLAGTYKATDRDWKIVIEEKEEALFGNDGGYRYKLNPIGEDQFINLDDGATVVFDAQNKEAITFVIFGRVKFEKEQ
jgi:CubicO group peptidase (beta-lactamase class C family)